MDHYSCDPTTVVNCGSNSLSTFFHDPIQNQQLLYRAAPLRPLPRTRTARQQSSGNQLIARPFALVAVVVVVDHSPSFLRPTSLRVVYAAHVAASQFRTNICAKSISSNGRIQFSERCDYPIKTN